MTRLLSIILCLALIGESTLGATAQDTPLPDRYWHPPAVGLDVVLYYLEAPPKDPAVVARQLAAKKEFGFKVVDVLDKRANHQALMQVISTRQVLTDMPPPSLEMLHYFGRGLTQQQAIALQNPTQALMLGFAYPADQKLKALQKALALIAALAEQGNVIVWDIESREGFTPQTWSALRVKTWQGSIPDVSKHIVIHAYNDDGNTRAITLGMGRFGLPDLVVEKTVWSLNTPLGNTMNALAQKWVENVLPDSQGLFHLDIHSIRHEVVRNKLASTITTSGQGQGILYLAQSKPEPADPDNWLVSISFDEKNNPSPTESQVDFVAKVFGTVPDELIRTRHDAALLEASERARAKLPALKKRFEKGLAPGEQLIVKAPFITSDGGSEWMWVEVTAWQNDKLQGMLRSDPRYTTNVKVGQIVDVNQADLFDYILRHPDGHEEGNETTKIILARPK